MLNVIANSLMTAARTPNIDTQTTTARTERDIANEAHREKVTAFLALARTPADSHMNG
ncbi:hypothetical protein [Oricola indica]|uniref:hypothetical protein n=1 Tax=Oricola indica TaxID=2872591 RepID=UPI001CBCFAB5|nr:hypothetical protein [Oricola indica]